MVHTGAYVAMPLVVLIALFLGSPYFGFLFPPCMNACSPNNLNPNCIRVIYTGEQICPANEPPPPPKENPLFFQRLAPIDPDEPAGLLPTFVNQTEYAQEVPYVDGLNDFHNNSNNAFCAVTSTIISAGGKDNREAFCLKMARSPIDTANNDNITITACGNYIEVTGDVEVLCFRGSTVLADYRFCCNFTLDHDGLYVCDSADTSPSSTYFTEGTAPPPASLDAIKASRFYVQIYTTGYTGVDPNATALLAVNSEVTLLDVCYSDVEYTPVLSAPTPTPIATPTVAPTAAPTVEAPTTGGLSSGEAKRSVRPRGATFEERGGAGYVPPKHTVAKRRSSYSSFGSGSSGAPRVIYTPKPYPPDDSD